MKLTLFNNLPVTKSEIVNYTKEIKDKIKEGELDPLETKIKLKIFSEIIKDIEKDDDVKEIILDEAEKYGKNFDFSNANIQIRAKSSYDFKACGDSKWEELNKQMEELKKELKEREELLKALKAPIADAETGEIITPPRKRTTDYIAITLKKD